MHRFTKLPRIVLIGCLLSGLVTGCGWNPFGTTAKTLYEGRVEQTTTAEAGPLQLQVWRVDYEVPVGGSSRGRAVFVTSETTVFLKLKNTSTDTVVILPNAASFGPIAPTPAPGEEPPSPAPPYYLRDNQGRTYAATGSGWSQAADAPRERMGTAPPGETAEFLISFPGIPLDVRELTLVMDHVPTKTGQSYDLKIAVPLPKTAGAR
jgi:hypothetical protein